MSKHVDFLGHRYKRTYVVITDIDGLIVSGIFKNYDKAVGHVMNCIWEFSESYKGEGDIFEIGEMQYDENNDSITVKFKDATWKEPCEETYWIIPYDRYKKKWNAPKSPLKEVGGT